MAAITYSDIGTKLSRAIQQHAIAMARKKSLFAHWGMGDYAEGEKWEDGSPKFANVLPEVAGNLFKIDLEAPFPALARTANKAARLAARTPNTDDFLVANHFALTHFPVEADVDVKDAKRMQATPEQGGWDLLATRARRIVLTVEEAIANAMLSATTGGTGDLESGGLVYAIDAANTYGTSPGVDRADASGLHYRGQVHDLDNVTDTKALSLRRIRIQKRKASEYGNSAELVIAGGDVYDIIGDLVEAASGGNEAIIRDNKLEVSAEYFMYNGTFFTNDPHMPAETLIGITPDPEEFDIRAQLPDGKSAKFDRNQGRVAIFTYQDDLFLSCVVKRPARHFKILNIETAAA